MKVMIDTNVIISAVLSPSGRATLRTVRFTELPLMPPLTIFSREIKTS
ncbi:MAG: hypothetical protein IJR35_09010 [Synergistaceae bacterium]|nr:hypothetical protein [Synergistaceae bacterium]